MRGPAVVPEPAAPGNEAGRPYPAAHGPGASLAMTGAIRRSSRRGRTLGPWFVGRPRPSAGIALLRDAPWSLSGGHGAA